MSSAAATAWTATRPRPSARWPVSYTHLPGIIARSDWVRVQAMLDVNKSKSYRRPRSNVALLSGLLRCGECGDYMRPKLTNRRTADGELIYTYMCSTKELSLIHISKLTEEYQTPNAV